MLVDARAHEEAPGTQTRAELHADSRQRFRLRHEAVKAEAVPVALPDAMGLPELCVCVCVCGVHAAAGA